MCISDYHIKKNRAPSKQNCATYILNNKNKNRIENGLFKFSKASNLVYTSFFIICVTIIKYSIDYPVESDIKQQFNSYSLKRIQKSIEMTNTSADALLTAFKNGQCVININMTNIDFKAIIIIQAYSMWKLWPNTIKLTHIQMVWLQKAIEFWFIYIPLFGMNDISNRKMSFQNLYANTSKIHFIAWVLGWLSFTCKMEYLYNDAYSCK